MYRLEKGIQKYINTYVANLGHLEDKDAYS